MAHDCHILVCDACLINQRGRTLKAPTCSLKRSFNRHRPIFGEVELISLVGYRKVMTFSVGSMMSVVTPMSFTPRKDSS